MQLHFYKFLGKEPATLLKYICVYLLAFFRRFYLDFQDTLSSEHLWAPHNVLRLTEFMSVKFTWNLHYLSTFFEKIQREENLVIQYSLAFSKVELHLSRGLQCKARSILVEKDIKGLPELILFNYQETELDHIRTIDTFNLK